MAEMLRCREAFSYDHKGVPVVVPKGALRVSGHPDVKGHPTLFEPVEDVATRESARGNLTPETASAAPGERRELSRPGQAR